MNVITAPETLKGSRNIQGFALMRAILSVLTSLCYNLLASLQINAQQIKLDKNHALKSSRIFVVNLFVEINSINQSNLFNLIAINVATGLRKFKYFYVPIKFCRNHALKSSRTIVVNLFNEINSMNQSNLFNLFAIIAATGSRKLKDYWPKNLWRIALIIVQTGDI